MLDKNIRHILMTVARFYDRRMVGDAGPLGFRRSTDLARLMACLDNLIDRSILVPGKSLFLDMGCADGRVNVLLSYLVKMSVGVELDDWTLDEYLPLKRDVETTLKNNDLTLPPDNIFLFHGNAIEEPLHETIYQRTGVHFEDFDLFYTYLMMQEEFAGLIAQRAKMGSVFMVYGLEKILPKFNGLRLLTENAMEGILALYRKE